MALWIDCLGVVKGKPRFVEDDLPHLERSTGRSVEVERVAGCHAQEFKHLGHEANIGVGNLVVRVGVEDQLAGRPLVPIGKGHALPDMSPMLLGVETDVEIVARQPSRNIGRGRGGSEE